MDKKYADYLHEHNIELMKPYEVTGWFHIFLKTITLSPIQKNINL